MADYGIKISKDGFDVLAVPTEATKKNYIILDTTAAHKVFYKGYVTAGSYTHDLVYKPMFFVFQVDSTSSPTFFKPYRQARSSTTQILNIPNPSYIIIFYEGLA